MSARTYDQQIVKIAQDLRGLCADLGSMLFDVLPADDPKVKIAKAQFDAVMASTEGALASAERSVSASPQQ